VQLGLWYAECATSVILAGNRCLVMYNWPLARRLFDGYRTCLWLMLPTASFLLTVWFLPPCLFSSIDIGWYFNPHVGYRSDFNVYFTNTILTVNNVLAVTLLVTIYTVFLISLYRTQAMLSLSYKRRMTQEISSFVQIFIVCALNGLTALSYVYMQLGDPPEWITTIAAYAFVLTQGSPAVIYLSMNQTIRGELRALLVKSVVAPACKSFQFKPEHSRSSSGKDDVTHVNITHLPHSSVFVFP
jgi:putative chemoreceptor